MVATLIRMTGDWDLAEECAQDAFAARAGALASRRRPAPPRRVAHHDGPQPRAGPLAPRGDRKPRSCGRERRCAQTTNRTSQRRTGEATATAAFATTGCG